MCDYLEIEPADFFFVVCVYMVSSSPLCIGQLIKSSSLGEANYAFLNIHQLPVVLCLRVGWDPV